MEIMKAVLGLEDGQFVVGEGFGVEGECAGELVFNTQMTGYMESLTDPSYFGQILMFTFPLIGNYGVDTRTSRTPVSVPLAALQKRSARNPMSRPSIRSYFEEQGLFGMPGVDTRALTIKTRVHGTMRAALVVGSDDGEYAVRLARKPPGSLISSPSRGLVQGTVPVDGSGKRIAVIDLGIKKNMITSLMERKGDLRLSP